MPSRKHVSIVTMFKRRRAGYGFWLLTCSWTSRHALASGTVDSASVLLQRFVGETARAVRCLASLNDVAGSVADALDIGDGGRGYGDEAKENGGDGELHLGEMWCLGCD